MEQLQLRLLGLIGSGRLIKVAGLIDRMADGAFDFTPWTPVFNFSGQSAMSVPLHWNADGLPVGVHFVARVGHETTLLQLAGQLERARPWFKRLARIEPLSIDAKQGASGVLSTGSSTTAPSPATRLR